MTNLLPVYARSDYTFERGEGVYLFDEKGNKYLDFAAGIAVNSIGHCHPHLVKALQDQAGKLWHVSNMYHIQGAEKLAKRICDATDFADYVFFCNSGGEAVECGIKMIRKYFSSKGLEDKKRIITFDGAFHGRTISCISAAGRDKLIEGFSPLLDGFDKAKYNDLDSVRALITDKTAGIMIEPVQGEGGIRVCPDEFLQGLRQIADEHGLLIFYDGVQCGMGRTGKFFSHEWSGAKPDIVSSAKGIGSGFPLGACLSTKEVGDAMTAGSHGSTYAGNPLSVAVGNAVMDVMLADGFLDNVVDLGEYLKKSLENLVDKYPNHIVEIRGRGLMLGIKLNEDKISDNREFVNNMRKSGLLSAPAADNVVRLLPPLVIENSHIDDAVAIIEETIKNS